jgi:hypothetical protein
VTDRCRSCNAPIRWAQTEVGRAIPLDAEPVQGGNIELTTTTNRHGAVVQVARIVEGGEWQSHFATCPNAAQHRRRA